MSASQMQAAVVAAPSQVRITQVPLPEPGECEVRVKLEGCGVCGSNLAPWEARPWFSYPLAPGEFPQSSDHSMSNMQGRLLSGNRHSESLKS